ncbi:MAG: anion transporter [Anaerolineaceae bacterium]|nr:anion transporter [Anaerolineaceae bacterium]
MSNNLWVTSSIVLLTYIGIAVGFVPKFRANRTTIALIGAGLLILFGQVGLKDIGGFLDVDTLMLLFSMMILNANLRLAGFFKLTSAFLLRLTRKPMVFLLIEIIIVGVLSAFFLNDTICIMLTPFLLELLLAMDRNPIPYLIALATAANIGSTATLTGNPQNMIIGVASGISYTQFAAALAPIALLGLGCVWLVLKLFYPKEFAASNFFPIPPTQKVHYYKPLLIKTSLITVGMLIAFILGVPIATAAFIAACALLLTRRVKPEKVFAEIDWGILVFFSALFIVTGALDKNGVTTALMNNLQLGGHENVFNLSLVTVVLSNLVSNVPAVLLLRPLIAAMSNPLAGWLTLAAASTLAGNLTLLGSVANLIVAESAHRRKVALGFWEYTKAGALITLLTLIISTGWLQLFVWK